MSAARRPRREEEEGEDADRRKPQKSPLLTPYKIPNLKPALEALPSSASASPSTSSSLSLRERKRQVNTSSPPPPSSRAGTPRTPTTTASPPPSLATNGAAPLVVANAVLPNGDKYTGEVNAASRPHGYGVLQSSRKAYEGEFRNGLQHGKGTTRYQRGDIFTGNFVRGKRHGAGVFAFHSGDRYHGEFSCGEFDGFGTMKWSDGSSFEGIWERGSMRRGVKYDAGDKSWYRGSFENGLASGYGVMTLANGTTQEGFFSKGALQGKGIIRHEGAVLSGRFHKGRVVKSRGSAGAGTIRYSPRVVLVASNLASGRGRMDGHSVLESNRFDFVKAAMALHRRQLERVDDDEREKNEDEEEEEEDDTLKRVDKLRPLLVRSGSFHFVRGFFDMPRFRSGCISHFREVRNGETRVKSANGNGPDDRWLCVHARFTEEEDERDEPREVVDEGEENEDARRRVRLAVNGRMALITPHFVRSAYLNGLHFSGWDVIIGRSALTEGSEEPPYENYGWNVASVRIRLDES